jgi:transcriptional regulator with XRE-family HTH domain
MIVGKRLKALREAEKLNAEELATAIGIARQQIARYENEQTDLTSETLVKLADFFGVSTDYLLGRTDEPGEAAPKIKRMFTWNIDTDALLKVFSPEKVAKTVKASGVTIKVTPEVIDVKELLNEYPPKLVATFLKELGYEIKIKPPEE